VSASVVYLDISVGSIGVEGKHRRRDGEDGALLVGVDDDLTTIDLELRAVVLDELLEEDVRVVARIDVGLDVQEALAAREAEDRREGLGDVAAHRARIDGRRDRTQLARKEQNTTVASNDALLDRDRRRERHCHQGSEHKQQLHGDDEMRGREAANKRREGVDARAERESPSSKPDPNASLNWGLAA